MDDDVLLFDASDALVTADIDLIMDDELPSDTLGAEAAGSDATGGVDAHARWQDDAARILFACMDPADDAPISPVKPRSASVSTMSTASSSSGSDNDDDEWRRPSFSGGTRTSSSSSSRIYHQHASHRATASTLSAVKFEPSHEPCSGEIPYSDLVFWLGNTATGEVECSCPTCARGRRSGGGEGRGRNGLRSWRFSPYERISSKIPVVSIPRIEGWN